MNAWVLRGKIVKGFQRGGTMLGYPTANIQLDETCITQLHQFMNTVWCGFAMIEDEQVPGEDLAGFLPRVAVVKGADGRWSFQDSVLSSSSSSPAPAEVHFVYPTVLSVGSNPHFKNVAITVEPYLIHKFAHDFYDRHLRIVAVEKIRDMGAYTSLQALIAQIKNDCRVGSQKLQKPQSLAIRSALVDANVWKDDAANAEAAPSTSLPGFHPDRSFFRKLTDTKRATAQEQCLNRASHL